MAKRFILLIISLVLVSCAPYTYQSDSTVNHQYDLTPPTRQTVKHQYELLVVDVDGKPLEGAKVECKLTHLGKLAKESSVVTGPSGKIVGFIDFWVDTAYLDVMFTSDIAYKTEFDYKITKEGYHPASGSISSTFGSKYSFDKNPKIGKVTLIKSTVKHQYELLVVDVNGNPLKGVTVEYTLKNQGNLVKDGSFVTKSDGRLVEFVQATPDSFFGFYKTEFEYKITKEGYYSRTGEELLIDEHLKTETVTVTLICPTDYLSPTFASSRRGIALKAKISAFIDLIRLESLLADSYLETQSINLIKFKGRRYLHFKFVTTTVYNSLRLNKYDIGKRLFDEVVRKVLSPLNKYITAPKLFFGYDLEVIGYTKSFADEYASSQPIEYRFIIPQATVRRYKNKDISGQQLLDASVILMDDERIELKLQ